MLFTCMLTGVTRKVMVCLLCIDESHTVRRKPFKKRAKEQVRA
jgi:hypothetical protein